MGYFPPVESNVHLSGKWFVSSLENSPLLLIRELSFEVFLIPDSKLLANWVALVQNDVSKPYKAAISVSSSQSNYCTGFQLLRLMSAASSFEEGIWFFGP